MHEKIMPCWHILTACKVKVMKTRGQQMRAEVCYKINYIWTTSLQAESGYKLTLKLYYFKNKVRISPWS